tara:strand:+ start:45953 stop:46165 length:213 start_codon:yes stop_codon:yes gene_type:complete
MIAKVIDIWYVFCVIKSDAKDRDFHVSLPSLKKLEVVIADYFLGATKIIMGPTGFDSGSNCIVSMPSAGI